jgi:hypothetical protein
MKVKTTRMLTHPSSSRIQLPAGSVSTKEHMIRDLGKANYDFAVKQGWIIEENMKGQKIRH